MVIVCLDECAKNFNENSVWSVGSSVKEYARKLFALLRKSDEDGYDAVICQGVADDGMGLSVNNRLSKACGGKFI